MYFDNYPKNIDKSLRTSMKKHTQSRDLARAAKDVLLVDEALIERLNLLRRHRAQPHQQPEDPKPAVPNDEKSGTISFLVGT